MPEQAGTLETIVRHLWRALQPLEQKLTSGNIILLFAELGLQFPPELLTQDFLNSLQTGASAAGALPNTITQLSQAIDTGDEQGILTAGAHLVEEIGTVVSVLVQIGEQLKTMASNLASHGMDSTEVTQFAENLASNLLGYLIISYLEEVQPGVVGIGNLFGIFDYIPNPGIPGDPAHPPFITHRLQFSRVGDLFTRPDQLLRNLYHWGDPAPPFDGEALIRMLWTSLALLGAPSHILDGPPVSLESSILSLQPNTLTSPPGVKATLSVTLPGGVDLTLPIAGVWSVHLSATGTIAGGLEVTVVPPFDVTLHPLAALNAQLEMDLVAQGPDAAHPIIIFGQTGGSRLQTNSFKFGAGIRITFDSSSGTATAEPLVKIEIRGGRVVIDMSNADGFLATALSGVHLEAGFDLTITWAPDTGVHIEGGAQLEIALPLHVSLGPVSLSTLYLVAGASSSGIPVEISSALGLALGPLQAAVDRVGVTALVTFPDHGGNLGAANLAINFKPPNGVGLSIDAGVIRGGGFLFIDTARGEYAGALELTFSEIVSLKAIGLITTRMPDGSDGFSLLIIITAEFGSGFQLGFGFTLLAVGGLLGLNRTMLLQPLMDGIRTGSIESIMFPQDVVANAPRIISDLRIIFPPLEGKFLIGPMAKLGWGTPTLISISLGIIIEIPGNLAILGILKIAIPADEIALIILQVNFAGAIEFDRKRLYFFAALFESRIVFLTIEGEMGLLVAFGDDANFVVSVGGFHPRFNPPPLPFPSPRRISVSLLNTPVSRIRIEGYFAVTSNTVQFGARVEVFFGLDEINVQGHLAFDALFQFSPFFFIIEISASFSVKVFGIGLFSVSVRGSLDGPAPYHVKGHGSISFLFFDVDVDFETTWGESRHTELPPIPVMPILEGEINKSDNWRALLPATNNLLVSLRQMPPEEAALILHPLGVLHISQRALPLELKVDKVGTQKPNDVNRLSVVVTGGGLAKKDDAFEQFAPAQFQNFSDADKLSRPAFAPEKSGLNLSAAGADTRSSRMVKRIVRYEEIIIDSNFRRFQRSFAGYFGSLFAHFLSGNAVSRSAVSFATRLSLQPFADTIAVNTETYTVAFQSNNTAFTADAVSFQSEASARDYMDRQIAADASLADE